MGEVGRSQVRVDAYDKATGRTKYYEDQMPQDALYVRIKHAEIAHGFVKSVDTAAAEAIDGVVKVLKMCIRDRAYTMAYNGRYLAVAAYYAVSYTHLDVDKRQA